MKISAYTQKRRIGGGARSIVLFIAFIVCCATTLPSSMFASAFSNAPLNMLTNRLTLRSDGDRTPGTIPIGERAVRSSACFAFGGGDNNDESDDANKFDMAQRIESLKSVVLGALSGGIALTPIAYLHYVVFGSDISSPGGSAQWEFTTDMSSLEAALFAIVYRYAVRANDNNPMLNQGVVGAFVVVRTLSNIRVSNNCQSVPLTCGPPLGYFDWNMIEQAAWGGVESAVLFGAASLAMELAFRQNWISKFD